MVMMTYGSALMLMLIEYMERCYFGFGRTACTSALVHVWIWMCVITWYTVMTPSELHVLLLFNCYMLQCHIVRRWYWCWLNIWNGIMLALDEQGVRWYWCMLEFECVITWYAHDAPWTTRSQLHTRLLFNDNGNGIRLYLRWCWLNIWTVSCWIWTNRKYVGIGACLNLNVSAIAWYTTHHDTITIANSPVIQLQWQWYTAMRWC